MTSSEEKLVWTFLPNRHHAKVGRALLIELMRGDHVNINDYYHLLTDPPHFHVAHGCTIHLQPLKCAALSSAHCTLNTCTLPPDLTKSISTCTPGWGYNM